MHRERHGFPALTAAVSIDGEVTWTGAVGWADLDARIAATRDTVMRIGSTSKAVTATALARLIDRGEMSLDAPLSEYSTDWPNPAWHDLTPRQLGSHTAGMPEYEDNGDRMGQLATLFGSHHYSSVRESLEIFDGADCATWPGDDSRALPFAHHGGVSKGAMSWLVVYPDHRLSIAINTNTRAEEFSDFNAVEGEIAALFLGRLEELSGN